jgi:hypothetical protein
MVDIPVFRMIDAFETDNELISVAEYIPGELYRYN